MSFSNYPCLLPACYPNLIITFVKRSIKAFAYLRPWMRKSPKWITPSSDPIHISDPILLEFLYLNLFREKKDILCPLLKKIGLPPLHKSTCFERTVHQLLAQSLKRPVGKARVPKEKAVELLLGFVELILDPICLGLICTALKFLDVGWKILVAAGVNFAQVIAGNRASWVHATRWSRFSYYWRYHGHWCDGRFRCR